MPARNIYHDAVVRALTADGWTITADPLRLSYGSRELYVDLGAERTTVAAERNGEKIAVEIQSFLSDSPVRDLEEALGQYVVYYSVMSEEEPDRVLYLAVPQRAYEELFVERFGQLIITRLQVRLVVFDEKTERINQWIPSTITERS
jgi:XisH protein